MSATERVRAIFVRIDPRLATLIRAALERVQRPAVTSVWVPTLEEALTHARQGTADVAVLDVRVPELRTALADLKRTGTPAIVLGTPTELERWPDAVQAADDVLATTQLSGEVLARLLWDTARYARTASALLRRTREVSQLAWLVGQALRPPLTQAEGAVALATDYGNLEPRIHRRLQDARQALNRLNGIADLLRAYAAADAPPERQTVRLGALVDDLEERLADTLRRYGGTLTHSDLPTVSVDVAGMREALRQLVLNGLAYNRSAVPHVHVEVQEAESGYVVRVRDNGTGLPSADADRLFEPLETGGTSQGLGLGLALVRKVVRQHGGRLWTEPAPGGGTAVCFTLPGA